MRKRDFARVLFCSHRRCFLIEVMGRNSGYLALTTAITTGAEVAVIPEFMHNMPRILDMLANRYRNRLNDSIILLAEGVCDADEFIKKMQGDPGAEQIVKQEIRKTVLGHVQRGGRPTHADRLLAEVHDNAEQNDEQVHGEPGRHAP